MAAEGAGASHGLVAREEASTRVSFTREETSSFLAIVSEMNISELLDSRRQRNQAHFQKIQAEMAALGYHWSWQQLRTHWKNLKSRYNKELLEQSKSGAGKSTWQWFSEMNALLAHRPMSQALHYGIDSNEPDESEDSRADTCASEADDVETLRSTQSSPEASCSQPPRKRSRYSKHSELRELFADQQSRSAELLRQHTDMIFQQQRQLLQEERNNMNQLMANITTSFLQGTQALLSQVFSQQMQMTGHQPAVFSFPAQGPFVTTGVASNITSFQPCHPSNSTQDMPAQPNFSGSTTSRSPHS
ncbi:uncharacterized protein LOC142587433 [Dermacentor variabilis]